MYLIKKISKKNGKIYFVLVVKGFGTFEGQNTYININYSRGLELADQHSIKIYDDKGEQANA